MPNTIQAILRARNERSMRYHASKVGLRVQKCGLEEGTDEPLYFLIGWTGKRLGGTPMHRAEVWEELRAWLH